VERPALRVRDVLAQRRGGAPVLIPR